jgi:anti-anti-sigma factor
MDPSGDFAYELTREGEQAVVRLWGELDMASAPSLAECLQLLRSNCVATVVLDLGRLDFCDSSGLNVFIGFSRDAQEQGSHLLLRAPSPAMLRLLEISGTADLLEVDSSSPELHASS